MSIHTAVEKHSHAADDARLTPRLVTMRKRRACSAPGEAAAAEGGAEMSFANAGEAPACR
jgi:hypothetical protein